MYKENRVSRTDVRRGEKEGKGMENGHIHLVPSTYTPYV